MTTPRLLYVNNGSGLGTAKSGGTTRLIETAKRFISWGIQVDMVTTPGCADLFIKENLPVRPIVVKASLFRSQESNNFDRVISYVISTLHSLWVLCRREGDDIVYAPSDYFCDVIPCAFYKWKNKGVFFVAMIHHLCRPPWKRRGNFFVNLFSYILQRVDFILLSRCADALFVYDTGEGEEIRGWLARRGFPLIKVYSVWNGIDFDFIRSVPSPGKVFDGCFVGGLRASKGIIDLIPIWREIVNARPQAKLVVIGEGAPAVVKEFKRRIQEAGLENHFVLTGALCGQALFEKMKSSRIFLSTSREEGWGISVCEGLACQLAVVAFDLPAFRYLDGHAAFVEMGHHSEFAQKCLRILEDKGERSGQTVEDEIFIRQFDWRKIAEREWSLISRISGISFDRGAVS